mmetsp:Transcript_123697/g.395811  ORF Transcript_123697/g.395811 Transcript_123697/m.395811 type:complete len:261 (+) Transcript_123697:357-1139(+)
MQGCLKLRHHVGHSHLLETDPLPIVGPLWSCGRVGAAADTTVSGGGVSFCRVGAGSGNGGASATGGRVGSSRAGEAVRPWAPMPRPAPPEAKGGGVIDRCCCAAAPELRTDSSESESGSLPLPAPPPPLPPGLLPLLPPPPPPKTGRVPRSSCVLKTAELRSGPRYEEENAGGLSGGLKLSKPRLCSGGAGGNCRSGGRLVSGSLDLASRSAGFARSRMEQHCLPPATIHHMKLPTGPQSSSSCDSSFLTPPEGEFEAWL